ncbi:hypothetical protein HPB50_018138 [Hyalomma asiaticum]|uniref:Uncharacterized protein n=1 Tax=Hyalomma asiaticum TaxID=266040 RepID=A0ACB7T9A4_HYAAI|nr:hypothetical protein HPB50_018138 [Hyalomma asiaticum]
MDEPVVTDAICVLKPSRGSNVTGVLNFQQEDPDDFVTITGDVTGLSPGLHGFHIHLRGDLTHGLHRDKASTPSEFQDLNDVIGKLQAFRNMNFALGFPAYPGHTLPKIAQLWHVVRQVSRNATEGCASTGPHFDVGRGSWHGARVDVVRHVGDLGNVEADSRGEVFFTIKDRLVSLNGPNSIVGRSAIIHELEDDLGQGGSPESRITGRSGSIVACGIIGVTHPKGQ